MKKILYLHVKKKYFDEIKAGTKTEEYRRFNLYWRIRLGMKTFDEIHVLCGYPEKDDPGRTLIFPWKGYTIESIQHAEFGKDRPVEVYAILLEK